MGTHPSMLITAASWNPKFFGINFPGTITAPNMRATIISSLPGRKLEQSRPTYEQENACNVERHCQPKRWNVLIKGETGYKNQDAEYDNAAAYYAAKPNRNCHLHSRDLFFTLQNFYPV
jgi:hypothetical protein